MYQRLKNMHKDMLQLLRQATLHAELVFDGAILNPTKGRYENLVGIGCAPGMRGARRGKPVPCQAPGVVADFTARRYMASGSPLVGAI